MYMAESGLHPRRLRKPAVTILPEILEEKAKLNEELVKENNEILHDFLTLLMSKMKERDELFALLHPVIYYTGSFYSDLRVSKPDEYDLNIVLNLPFKLHEISVQYHSQVPSYVKYKVMDQYAIVQKNLSRLFEDGYLIPVKVRTWMQSVISKALNTDMTSAKIFQVHRSSSGPAQTIILVTRYGNIDIDLVPVVECSMDPRPPGIDGRVYAKVANDLECFIVPKPYQPCRQAPVNDAERARLWRVHYPDAESKIIHDLGCVKPVIRLLKLLRNKEDRKIIASYYLKTIVMWMVLKNPDKEYWKLDKIDKRFLDALKTLAECVKNKEIPYFFSSRYNLLEKLTDAESINIYYRLQAILKDIERDDWNLWRIFDCPPTFDWNM